MTAPQPGWRLITDREWPVLRLLVDGRTQSQIASDLGVTLRTVTRRLQSIKTKLGAATTNQAVAVACLNRLITRGDT